MKTRELAIIEQLDELMLTSVKLCKSNDDLSLAISMSLALHTSEHVGLELFLATVACDERSGSPMPTRDDWDVKLSADLWKGISLKSVRRKLSEAT